MKNAFLLICTVLFSAALHGQSNVGYYRFPAVHGDTVVFTAEGDLWRVGLNGGIAQRLTTHAGMEANAAISPNGHLVAFSAQYEGATEVYVMPVEGGLPKRLTFEGNARPYGWTPTGQVIYATANHSGLPDPRLVTINPQTLEQQLVPLAQACEGSYDDSGNLYFTRLPPNYGKFTKRYEGGAAQNLWVLPSKGAAARLAADFDGTSKNPVWSRGRLYFLTDRDGTMNLWSMKGDGADLRQITRHKDFGLRSFSLDGEVAVYQNGADLWRCNLSTGDSQVIAISLSSDFDQMREKWVTKPMDLLSHLEISPDGGRVALTVRGRVFVAPVEPGRLIEATRQEGVRYRQAGFFPDGKSLYTLSDESGEVEFWKVPANGTGARTMMTKDASNLRTGGWMSPDGKHLAYTEHNGDLSVIELASGQTRKVAHATHGEFESAEIDWSPDSQWLAFSMAERNGVYPQIYVYGLAESKMTAVTSERSPSGLPAWSPDGKWLYYVSSRHLESRVSQPWGFRAPQPYFDKTMLVYQLALTTQPRSPFEAANELTIAEKPANAAVASSEKKEGAKDDKPDNTEKPAVKVEINFNGLAQRHWQVPIPAGNYSNLAVTPKHLLLQESLNETGSSDPGQPSDRLIAYEIKERDVEGVTVMDGIRGFTLSADRKKLAVRKPDAIYVIDAGPAAPSKLDKAKLDLTGLSFSYQPKESWREMFTDAWRMHRDFFYDPAMHGIDWKANLAKHLPLVDRITDRDELDDILTYMMSELSALHAYVVPGEKRKGSENIDVASLGAELTRDRTAGGWRISHIYQGDTDYPEALSPLLKAGLRISEGDVITAINGTETLTVPHPAALLRGLAGRQVMLRLQAAAGGASFDQIVKPITSADAAKLRYGDWELSRRQQVEAAGAGNIGYVHLRAMGPEDAAQWARDFFPMVNRQGLILDLRHNNGGNIDSWILGSLLRKTWMYWAPRDGVPQGNMQDSFRGHIVALIDAQTASDGETTANGLRRLGLGKLIGMRTWGGGIWLSQTNRMVDNGVAAAGETGTYGPERVWVVEGRGINPDIRVDNPPDLVFHGSDPQLEAALRYLQEEIAKDPRPVPEPPAFPNKSAH